MTGIFVDNFAGGGGASVGIEQALGKPVDYALNHDALALAMHKVNHPQTVHLQENIQRARPRDITQGRDLAGLWMSPDCTFWSKARGGMPWRDPVRAHRSRGLCWTLIRWLLHARPRVFFLENVEEFIDACPLKKVGRREWVPDWERAGELFQNFCQQVERFGFKLEFRQQRAMMYGAGTIRRRLFMIGRCDGEPIVWPDATHGPGLKPFVSAADCIDWSIPCPSIFDRDRPLAANTMARIARGISKYVINNAEPFLVPITHQGDSRVYPIGEPMRTITGANRGEQAVIVPTLIQTGWGEREGQAPRCLDLAKPLGTILGGGNKHALVSAFLAQHNGGFYDGPGRDAADPLSTITQRGTQQQVVTSHLVKFYGTCEHGQAVTEPLPTITAGRGHHVGEVRAFLMRYFGTEQSPDLLSPLATVTTKHRDALVMVHGQPYQIVDIGMRMLTTRELYTAQGFPLDYVIHPECTWMRRGKPFTGPMTITESIKKCGNSVAPPHARALVAANMPWAMSDEARERWAA